MIYISAPEDKVNVNYRSDNVIYFDLNSETLTSSVVKATLGLYVRRPTDVPARLVTPMTIDKVLSRTEKNACRFKYKKINLNRMKGTTDKWYTFDVTRMVQNWIANSSTNFGLHIQSDPVDGRSLVITHPGDDESAYVSVHLVHLLLYQSLCFQSCFVVS